MLLSNPCDPDPRVLNEAEALVEAGNQVKIVAWDRELKSPSKQKINGVEIERLRLKSTYSRGFSQIVGFLRFNFSAFRKLIKSDFDVVHCHDFDTLPAGFFAANLKKKKLVYDSHEYYSALMKDHTLNLVSNAVLWFESFVLKKADLVIVVNDSIKHKFISRGANHVNLILNSKNLKDYKKIKKSQIDAYKNKFKIGKKKILLYIGTFAPNRNLLEIIDLVKGRKDIVLIIGGEGVLENEIKRKAKLYPNIIFLGKVPESRVPFFTKLADINLAVYKSNYLNNLIAGPPNKLFESIAAGTPILTSKDGVTGKLVQRLGCGIVVNPEEILDIQEKLFGLLKNQKKYFSIKNQIKKIQPEFDWQKEKLKLVKLYERL